MTTALGVIGNETPPITRSTRDSDLCGAQLSTEDYPFHPYHLVHILWIFCHSVMNTLGPLPQSTSQVKDAMAAFDSVPLFMKSLPEDSADDVTMNALQSLVFEGTPDGEYTDRNSFTLTYSQITEIAQNFKQQGNDYFKGKRYREAMGFYTQGIDANPDDQKLTEALLSNRAACNLELSKMSISVFSALR